MRFLLSVSLLVTCTAGTSAFAEWKCGSDTVISNVVVKGHVPTRQLICRNNGGTVIDNLVRPRSRPVGNDPACPYPGIGGKARDLPCYLEWQNRGGMKMSFNDGRGGKITIDYVDETLKHTADASPILESQTAR